MPKISIIIPVYNVEDFLIQSLDSVINQTILNWELICVNDGSTDQCDKILNEYAKKDNRIKVITQSNQGVSTARNTALDVITGDYVAFLDPDDIMHPQFLEVLLNNIIASKADIIWCKHAKIREDEKIENFPHISEEKFFDIPHHFERFTTHQKPYPSVMLWDKLYKKELFQNLRFVKEINVGEDLVLQHHLLHNATKVCFVDKNLIYYRERSNSLTHSKFSYQYIEDHLTLVKLLLKDFENKKITTQARKALNFRLQKMLCKSCITLPYKRANMNREYLQFWHTYSDVLSKLIKEGVYHPECLDLRNRFLTFLFIRKKFNLLSLLLKI